MHKHASELIRWANAKEYTEVWYKRIGSKEWCRSRRVSWDSSSTYVIDDKWATIRKAIIDGKEVQVNRGDGWEDHEAGALCLGEENNTDVWRIKPVYEYQWLVYDELSGKYSLTEYMTEELADTREYEKERFDRSKKEKICEK